MNLGSHSPHWLLPPVLIAVTACAPTSASPLSFADQAERDRSGDLAVPAAVVPTVNGPSDVLVLFGNDDFPDLANGLARLAKAAETSAAVLPKCQCCSSKFYIDSRRGGEDDEASLGVESAQLLFYIGHGRTSGWDAYNYDSGVKLGQVQFGDDELRYAWLSSCEVMAHGPAPFDRPHEFPQRPGTSENVFARWGGRYDRDDIVTTPLSHRLRLACGGSTELDVPSIDKITDLWGTIIDGGGPSDTFLEVFGGSHQVPLCITRGGPDPDTTPLYDRLFSSEENHGGDGGYLHIQYPVHVTPQENVSRKAVEVLFDFGAFGSPEGAEMSADQEPPSSAPILVLEPLPSGLRILEALSETAVSAGLGFYRFALPAAIQGLVESQSTDFSLGLRNWSAERLVYIHPYSGAISVEGEPGSPFAIPGLPHPSEVQLPDFDFASLEELADLSRSRQEYEPGRPRRVARAVEQIDMYIDRTLDAACASYPCPVKRYVKHHGLVVASAIDLPDIDRSEVTGGDPRRLYPVIGEGGVSRVDFAPFPRGDALRLRIGARRIKGCRSEDGSCDREEPLISRDRAQQDLLDRRPLLKIRYHPPTVTWGYLEAPVTCRQPEMGIAYRFRFESRHEGGGDVVIDVPAQVLEPWICAGDAEAMPEEMPKESELDD